MISLTYTVPGRPVTWARTNEVRGRRVTDKAQRQAKAVHALHARIAMGRAGWSLDGAFALDVIGYYPSAVTGDADRLASLAADALQCPRRCKPACLGICWHDDRQVRDVRSRIVCDGSPPRVVVTVRRLEVDPVAGARSRQRPASAAGGDQNRPEASRGRHGVAIGLPVAGGARRKRRMR